MRSKIKLSDPQITFAIPYYRNAKFLFETIESVLAQTNSNWKLIICDEGVESVEVQERLNQLRHPKISYFIHAQPLGIVGNWNFGLKKADTNLVCILHCDDRLCANYVDSILTAVHEYPCAAAFFCRTSIIDEHGKPTFSFADFYKNFLYKTSEMVILSGEEAIEKLLKGNFIFCPTVCYQKDVIGDVTFSDNWQMVQDLEFFTRILKSGKTIIGIPQVCYEYRRHSQNASHIFTQSKIRFKEEVTFYKQMERECLGLGWYSAAKIAKKMMIIRLNLLFIAFKKACCLSFYQSLSLIRFVIRPLDLLKEE